MIGELGLVFLILALVMSLIQAFVPFYGTIRNNAFCLALGKPAAYGQCFFLFLSFVCLSYCFVLSDFSVGYVAENSSTLLPTVYKITALWGAHEGSMLLWTLLLSLWGAIYARLGGTSIDSAICMVTTRSIAVLGLLGSCFLIFLLFTSNPFTRIFPVPVEGIDLNPFLQDPAFVIHPPLLYAGYVGYAVVFAITVSAFFSRPFDPLWEQRCFKWVVVAWLFLTAGIGMGSWWAYYELGWGGWWFWDPVENVSLLPWLVGIGLLHGMVSTQRTGGVLRAWVVFLALFAFALSLLGTFIVRSGLLISVHAFATDPTRGIYLLLFLGLLVGGAFVLFARNNLFISSRVSSFSFSAKESILLLVGVLFFVIAITIMLGVFYPVLLELFAWGSVSVGAPYYNRVVLPLAIIVLFVMGLSAYLRPIQDSWIALFKRLSPTLLGAAVLAVFFFWYLQHDRLQDQLWVLLLVFFAIFFAIWILLGTANLIRTQYQDGTLRSLSLWAMIFAHSGFALMTLGITIVSAHSTESIDKITVGEQILFADYKIKLNTFEKIHNTNYRGIRAHFVVTNSLGTELKMVSEKRDYFLRGMASTEAGIEGEFLGDIYISLGDKIDQNTWSFRVYYRPGIRLLWSGIVLMVLGGILSALRSFILRH